LTILIHSYRENEQAENEVKNGLKKETRKKQTVERRKQHEVKGERENDDEKGTKKRSVWRAITMYSVRGSFELSASTTEVAQNSDE
jgi:hypothetical protein